MKGMETEGEMEESMRRIFNALGSYGCGHGAADSATGSLYRWGVLQGLAVQTTPKSDSPGPRFCYFHLSLVHFKR